MFGLHIWELIALLILAVVFFGPKRIPEIGEAMGKTIKQFRKATSPVDEDADGKAN